MSKRLQVLLPEEEFARIQSVASSQHIAVGEFVRRELRKSCETLGARSVEAKLKAIRKAAEYNFPTADIEQMNAEIEKGYSSGLP